MSTNTFSQQTLVVTRGLQGSGKTTWAKRWVQENPARRSRINRDDLRMMVYGSFWLDNDHQKETLITKIQHDAVRAALKAGNSVVVDDTNLRVSFVRDFLKIAREFDGKVQLRIQDLDVSIDTAIARDAARLAKGERGVGEEVIRGASKRYMRGGDRLPVLDAEFYEEIVPFVGGVYDEDVTLPHAYLVDVDGTIAKMTGRSPFEWLRVDEDEPVQRVIEMVQDLKKAGHTIIIMSGRDGSSEALTREWMDCYGVPYDHLFMRSEGDMRKDNIIKHELFEEHIRGKFFVRGVLDDRDQVVRMWREKGLTVAQVAYGNF